MTKKLSLNEILKRFKSKHKGKFDYTKFRYNGKDIPSIIVCKKHNKRLEVTSEDHMRYVSGGCKTCFSEHSSWKQRMKIKDFILKALKVHKGKYDYSLSHQFENQHEKIIIICPIHGEFKLTPANHTHKTRPQGCKYCGLKIGGQKNSSNTKEFIKKAKKIHNNFYDYSKTEYFRDRGKIDIICHIHGVFTQVPRDHLSGHGCSDCAKIKQGNTSRRVNREIFIKNAKKVHGNKFDYKSLVWKDSDVPVEIICKKCGPFFIIPHNHTTLKRGCITCGRRMRIMQNSWLDYLKIPNDRNHREVTIKLNNTNYYVDGFDPINKVVYEFYGDYWHGNPKKFKPKSINRNNGLTFGFLYKNTKKREKIFKKANYKIISIWETNWNKIFLNKGNRIIY